MVGTKPPLALARLRALAATSVDEPAEAEVEAALVGWAASWLPADVPGTVEVLETVKKHVSHMLGKLDAANRT